MNREPKARGGTRPRKVETRSPLPRLLLVCEGTRTEPNYFRRFPAVSSSVRSIKVHGTGRNTASLVDEAERQSEGFDEVWCVFDRDSFPEGLVNQAYGRIAALDEHARQTGRSPRFFAAFSNEAFELRFLLHFHYVDAALSRHDYVRLLEGYLRRPYRKNDEQIYETLLPRQAEALRNAKRLRARQTFRTAATTSPWTTVDQLVERLNEILNLSGRLP